MSTVGIAFLTWVAATALLSVAAGAAYARVRARLLELDPRQRSTLILAICVLPACLSAVWTAFVFVPVPTLLDAHCHADASCTTHVPPAGPAWIVGLGTCGVAAVLLGVVAPACARWRAAFRPLRAVQRLAQRTERGYWITNTAEPLALSAGWFSPVAIVSRGLHRAVSAEDLEVIVHHEMAHGERRDNLRHLLATGASALFMRTARRLLLTDLRVAAEEACDAHAAVQVGDRLRVAGAILKYARLVRGTSECEIAAFGASATVERVHELLSPSTYRIGASQWGVVALAVAAAALMGAAPLHRAVEALLGATG